MADDTDWDAVAEMRAEEDAQRWADEHRPEVPAVTGVTRWIRKPVEVGALLWDGTNEQAVREFTGAPSGWAMVPPGWYAVKGDDEYPFLIDPGDFAARYEPAGETGAQADPPPPVAADLEVAALQTSAGCDRLDRMVTEYGDAIGAVRQAVDLLGARIHSAEDARIIADARDALRVLEGAEAHPEPSGTLAPAPASPERAAAATGPARAKDGSEGGRVTRLCPTCLHDGVLERTLDRAAAAEARLAGITAIARDAKVSAPSGMTAIVAAERILAVAGTGDEDRSDMKGPDHG